MARRNKELSAAFPQSSNSPPIFPMHILRALANGLFGKRRKYHPSAQEVADYYLTPREREIAYLAALGFSDVEIADALGMTFQAVRTHLRAVLTKMELDDPRALCAYFLERVSDADDV